MAGSVCLIAGVQVQASELRFVTGKAYISYTVPDHWFTVSLQSKPPVAFVKYQIPNPADASTEESTNLAIMLYSIDTEAGQIALKKVGKQFGSKPPIKSSYHEWTRYRQSAQQGNTTYVILDAKRNLIDMAIGVRLAWPRLPNNPASYDKDMETLFSILLDSIHGATGPVPVSPGDVIRRPQ